MKGDDNKKQRLVIEYEKIKRGGTKHESQMMEMQWTENETMLVNEHFWGMISCLDERLKVLDYLINHRAGKYAIGTIRAISEEARLSVDRVQKFLALERRISSSVRGTEFYAATGYDTSERTLKCVIAANLPKKARRSLDGTADRLNKDQAFNLVFFISPYRSPGYAPELSTLSQTGLPYLPEVFPTPY